jgi:GNAT superfamily N-acetyltransferase
VASLASTTTGFPPQADRLRWWPRNKQNLVERQRIMERSGKQKGGDDPLQSENAPDVRVQSYHGPIELTYLGKGAATVLWAHENEFQRGEHWYEYLIGAVAEGAKIWGITVPEDYYHVYAGFAEIFEWEEGAALESLYLFPKWRRSGIGTAAVKWIESGCNDRLTIWASRSTAPFYERLGYTRDDSQGGYIMTKRQSPGRTFTEAASQYWNSNG